MEAQVQQHSIEHTKEDEKEGITAKAIEIQFDKQQGRCYYTGAKLTFDNVSVEHTVPLGRGGTNTPSNITLVTKQVQAMKGTMTGEEFVEACDTVTQTKGTVKPLRAPSVGVARI